MWELDHKEGWALKNWCYQIAVLENILESPLDYREIKPINPKGNQMPEYSLEVLMLKFHYFGHLMWRTDSLEKALILGKNEGRRRRGWQRMRQLDGTTNSMEKTLILGKIEGRRGRRWQRMRWLDGITDSMGRNLSNLWRWWRTRKPGLLQTIGSPRIVHDWATEQQSMSISIYI